MNQFQTESMPTAHGIASGFADAMANPLANPLSAHFAPERDGATPIAVSWTEMVSHRAFLVRFARRRLLDPALAEDAVHDVFEAVMSGRANFEGRAALRSWLVAILKFKVVDIIRSRARYGSYDRFDMDEDQDGAGVDQLACDCAGPQELALQRELLGQALKRIDFLPKGLRDVMQFRVLQDESSQEVCERLHITESSLFVRLHRARKQLLN